MTRQETSIAFQTDKTPAQYRELAQLVNRYAFDVVSVYGDLPYQQSFGPLLLMAPHLERARLGPACVAPSRIPPIDMAGEIALLDHVTQGRAYLGVARGAWLEWHGVREDTPPVRAVRECVEIVKSLLCGEAGGYSGQVYQVAGGVRLPYPVFRPEIPILIGTWGKQLAAVAGELADEVKIGGSANAAMIPVMRDWIAAGEMRAGRAPGGVGIVIGAVTVVDEDGRAAKQRVKRDMAVYLPVVARLDVSVQIDPELLARIENLTRAGKADEATAQISDDLLAKFAFAGTSDEVLAHAQSLYDAGARRVEFGTPHGFESAHGIRLLGERVLPHLQLLR